MVVSSIIQNVLNTGIIIIFRLRGVSGCRLDPKLLIMSLLNLAAPHVSILLGPGIPSSTCSSNTHLSTMRPAEGKPYLDAHLNTGNSPSGSLDRRSQMATESTESVRIKLQYRNLLKAWSIIMKPQNLVVLGATFEKLAYQTRP